MQIGFFISIDGAVQAGSLREKGKFSYFTQAISWDSAIYGDKNKMHKKDT